MRSTYGVLHLCVVAPCYNEGAVIESFYVELTAALSSLECIRTSIVFVDDGSSDATLQILNRIAEKDATVQVLSLSRNFGHQIALTAGVGFGVAEPVLVMELVLEPPAYFIT